MRFVTIALAGAAALAAGCGGSGGGTPGTLTDVRYGDAPAPKDLPHAGDGPIVVGDPGTGADAPADPGLDPGPADVPASDPGPFDPGPSDPGPGDPGPSDPGTDTGPVCSDRTKVVYVATEENAFLRFDPQAKKFDKIGTLTCTGSFIATPFSMSIDREANAWVLYSDGRLFKVSTLDASCEPTTFETGQSDFTTFGMGFAADAPGSNDETLFVSRAVDFSGSTSTLGRISFPDLALTPIADLEAGAGSAELTGNGLGELWGFFPSASPALVARIDKTDGSLHDKVELPAAVSDVQAWAFAHWGGYYFLFVKSYADFSSSVYSVVPKTGDVQLLMSDVGYSITGAGVSSCAPTQVP